MRNYTLFAWVGVWLFALPFLGLPGNWKDRLVMLTAVAILAYAFVEYRRANRVEEAEGESSAGVEGAGDTTFPPTQNTA